MGQSTKKLLRVRDLDLVNNRTTRKPPQVKNKPDKQEEKRADSFLRNMVLMFLIATSTFIYYRLLVDLKIGNN